MNERRMRFLFAMVISLAITTGCAVRPKPDPRNPAPVRDTPWVGRVCYVADGTPHLMVGDQIELTTSNLGRLRIRHIPGPDNREPAWNGGESVGVKSAVLVERVDGKRVMRRFVPVGRFHVEGRDVHQRFDFMFSKAVENLRNDRYPQECNVELGADEVIIRGVRDDGRHDGHAHVRSD